VPWRWLTSRRSKWKTYPTRSVILVARPALSGAELTELLTLEEVERRHVIRVLEACHGNRTDAAKILGLDRKTLYRKLLRWGVSDE